MKRLIVIIAGISVASAICCVMQECERRHGPIARAVAPTVEIPTALKKAVQFFRPDTKSDIRFGKPTPKP